MSSRSDSVSNPDLQALGCESGKIIQIRSDPAKLYGSDRIQIRKAGVAYPVGVVLAHEAANVVRALHQQPSVTHLLLLWVT
jgi:hypothetical protein